MPLHVSIIPGCRRPDLTAGAGAALTSPFPPGDPETSPGCAARRRGNFGSAARRCFPGAGLAQAQQKYANRAASRLPLSRPHKQASITSCGFFPAASRTSPVEFRRSGFGEETCRASGRLGLRGHAGLLRNKHPCCFFYHLSSSQPQTNVCSFSPCPLAAVTLSSGGASAFNWGYFLRFYVFGGH